jgi:hypothetical protein
LALDDATTVRIRQCPGIYKDKHGEPHSIWRVVSAKATALTGPQAKPHGSTIGLDKDPVRGPKQPITSLNYRNLELILDTIDSCTEFCSVTLLPPGVWLTDPTLLAVLVAQTKSKSARKLRVCSRICVWDDIRPPGYDEIKQLHELAGIDFRVLLAESAKSIANKYSGKFAANGARDHRVLNFIHYPLQEFWVAYRNNRVVNAGYGQDTNNDGCFDTLQQIARDEAGRRCAAKWFSMLWGVR